jgi:type II secretory pathway pseudopilin PulG
MKISLESRRQQGLTLVEVLVIIAIVAIFAAMFPCSFGNAKARALRIQCVNNLKQTGLAYRIWEGDHSNSYPQAVSGTKGGSIEFITGAHAFRYFQIMSNELSTPKVLLCPADNDDRAIAATNFINLNNSNISYFVGLDATEANPQVLLSGDRNLTNGTPIKNGILELTPISPAGWTAEMQNKVGNILLADGSVQRESTMGLRSTVTNTPSFTNRLLLPVLQ